MKATEQYFPVVLFIMLHKVVPTFPPVDEILKCDHSNEATEQYFPLVLFIMLHKVVPTFPPVDEILKCDHSNEATEQYFPVVPFIMLYNVFLTFEILKNETFWKVLSSVLFVILLCKSEV